MLAYGAAESSIRLLQKFKLLDILLPIQVSGISAVLILVTFFSMNSRKKLKSIF